MKKYIQTDKLQKLINWEAIMPMERFAGGHDEQMKALFKKTEVVAHWNEGDFQGQVATCVRFFDGEYAGCYAIYNDYYGSCSGCDSWDDAHDADVRKLCIDLSNSTFIFKTLDDVKEFLSGNKEPSGRWGDFTRCAQELLLCIERGFIYSDF